MHSGCSPAESTTEKLKRLVLFKPRQALNSDIFTVFFYLSFLSQNLTLLMGKFTRKQKLSTFSMEEQN